MAEKLRNQNESAPEKFSGAEFAKECGVTDWTIRNDAKLKARNDL
jgi:hypothetical protein